MRQKAKLNVVVVILQTREPQAAIPVSTRHQRLPFGVRLRRAGVTVTFLGPAFGFLLLFVLVPVGTIGVLALVDFDPLTQATDFVGMANWHRVLDGPQLWQATGNTLLYALMTVPTQVVLGLLIALAIRAAGRGAVVWRTIYFAPTAATLAAMSVVWRWLFYPDAGIIDQSLGWLVGQHGWLGSTVFALPALAIVGSWAGIGSCVVMFLAGLSNVPDYLDDAARIDRANAWQRFWAVIWPAIGPATTFALVIALRDALRVYDQVKVLSDGGPLGSTTTLSFLAWQRGVRYLDIGGGSVVNAVLLVLVLVTVAVQLLLGGRRWEEAGRR